MRVRPIYNTKAQDVFQSYRLIVKVMISDLQLRKKKFYNLSSLWYWCRKMRIFPNLHIKIDSDLYSVYIISTNKNVFLLHSHQESHDRITSRKLKAVDNRKGTSWTAFYACTTATLTCNTSSVYHKLYVGIYGYK